MQIAKLVCREDNPSFHSILTTGPSQLCIPVQTNTSYAVLASCSAGDREGLHVSLWKLVHINSQFQIEGRRKIGSILFTQMKITPTIHYYFFSFLEGTGIVLLRSQGYIGPFHLLDADS